MDTTPKQPKGDAPSKIRHTQPQFGSDPTPTPVREVSVPEASELQVVESVSGAVSPKKITAFEKARRHEEKWSRTPNTTGQGAIHVRTFHCKLTADALTYLDQSVNEWLDAHPQYEVKFVTSTVGTLSPDCRSGSAGSAHRASGYRRY